MDRKLMPRIVVHCHAHADAALAAASELGVPVTLVSPPAASASMGAPFFQAIVGDADAVLDCGHAPGHALAALRQGVKAVRVAAAPEVRVRIADIAAQCGARLDEADEPALDLGAVEEGQWAAACLAFLGARASRPPLS